MSEVPIPLRRLRHETLADRLGAALTVTFGGNILSMPLRFFIEAAHVCRIGCILSATVRIDVHDVRPVRARDDDRRRIEG